MPLQGGHVEESFRMRKIGLLLPLVFLSGLSAQTAETIVYRALLLNTNELPAAPTAATGNATVWLHLVRDATRPSWHTRCFGCRWCVAHRVRLVPAATMRM